MQLTALGTPGVFSTLRALSQEGGRGAFASLQEGPLAHPFAPGNGVLASLQGGPLAHPFGPGNGALTSLQEGPLARPIAAARGGFAALQEGPLASPQGVRNLVRGGADVSRHAGIGNFLDLFA